MGRLLRAVSRFRYFRKVGFIFAEKSGYHGVINQDRFRCGRKGQDQFRTRIAFPFRHGRPDAPGMVRKAAAGSGIVQGACSCDAAADDSGEAVDAADGRADSDADECLLGGVTEEDGFLRGNHVEVAGGILAAHAAHLMFIQAGEERTVVIIPAAFVEGVIQLRDAADADGSAGIRMDFPEELQLGQEAGTGRGNLVKEEHHAVRGAEVFLEDKDFAGAEFEWKADVFAHFLEHACRAEGRKIRDEMDIIGIFFLELGEDGGLAAPGVSVEKEEFTLGVGLAEFALCPLLVIEVHVRRPEEGVNHAVQGDGRPGSGKVGIGQDQLFLQWFIKRIVGGRGGLVWSGRKGSIGIRKLLFHGKDSPFLFCVGANRRIQVLSACSLFAEEKSQGFRNVGGSGTAVVRGGRGSRCRCRAVRLSGFRGAGYIRCRFRGGNGG